MRGLFKAPVAVAMVTVGFGNTQAINNKEIKDNCNPTRETLVGRKVIVFPDKEDIRFADARAQHAAN